MKSQINSEKNQQVLSKPIQKEQDYKNSESYLKINNMLQDDFKPSQQQAQNIQIQLCDYPSLQKGLETSENNHDACSKNKTNQIDLKKYVNLQNIVCQGELGNAQEEKIQQLRQVDRQKPKEGLNNNDNISLSNLNDNSSDNQKSPYVIMSKKNFFKRKQFSPPKKPSSSNQSVNSKKDLEDYKESQYKKAEVSQVEQKKITRTTNNEQQNIYSQNINEKKQKKKTALVRDNFCKSLSSNAGNDFSQKSITWKYEYVKYLIFFFQAGSYLIIGSLQFLNSESNKSQTNKGNNQYNQLILLEKSFKEQELFTGVKDFYNNMLNLLPQGIVVVDSNKEMIYHNSSITKLLKCKPEQIMDQICNISTNQNEIKHAEMKYKSEKKLKLDSLGLEEQNVSECKESNKQSQNKNSSKNINNLKQININNQKQQQRQDYNDSCIKNSGDLNKIINSERTATIYKSNINILKHENAIYGNDQNLKVSQLLQNLFLVGKQQEESAFSALRRVQTMQNKNQAKQRKSSIYQKEKIQNLNFSDDCIQFQINFKNQCLLLNIILCKFQQNNIYQQKDISIEPVILIMIDDISQQIKIKELEVKNQCKMRMLASISHELRTPLNCSMTLLEVLKNLVSNPLAQEYIDPALNSQHLLLNIINDILDFAQIDVGKFKFSYEHFDLKNIIQNCLKLIEMQSKIKNIQLLTDFSEEVNYQFYSDPTRIRQIILNLLSNALKFTQKGYIMIRVEKFNESLTKITVEDTGIGIASEDIQKIFEIFGKVDLKNNKLLNTQGAGLGLSIASQLARGLGQNKKIEVLSELGKGSSFSFFLENKLNQKGFVATTDNNMESNLSNNELLFNNNSNNFPQQSQYYSLTNNTRATSETKAESSVNVYSKQINMFDSKLNVGNFKNSSQSASYISFNQNSDKRLKSYYSNSTLKPINTIRSKTQYQENKNQSKIIEEQNENQNVLIDEQQEYSKSQEILFDSFSAKNPENLNNLYDISNIQDQDCNDIDETKNRSISFNQGLEIRLKNMSLDTDYLDFPQNQNNLIKNDQKQNFQSDFNFTDQQQQQQELQGKYKQPNKISQNLKVMVNELIKCSCPPVLVVDDNEFNRYVLQKLLLTYNIQHVQAQNGQVAIDKVMQRYLKNVNNIDSQNNNFQINLPNLNSPVKCCCHFKIIFMDLDMPVKNGYEAVQEIKSFYIKNNLQKEAPIIVACTAFVGEEDKRKCEIYGMDYFLPKPISPKEIEKLLIEILQKLIKKQ
ncbi:ATPase, histidine kinase-, DNA gyrase B (macronuclear) [Tetrahymena thermophila SB210]|uniref:ATPase, histidine kinase-, DNA gyrase B n=1 Tax=Tetrahymena thermophila (strain SB210) TaxID=312017 RepID=Q24HP0_TETTS|nr:ATPase, histidine kinase-, DNA gyrase B [Tetrahymena thermophila SB210]EAS07271.2 ATPase, histidine kinase-, DNA gyrase B [Tetrahymena thermophila SB210]|eukprot:XP_001027513.2 ATPase, histidine kinase-, DNA gyrase B [Tetrahymena thermophila SB210]